MLRETPLHKKYAYKKISNSPKRIAHMSDALRLALIYKFGGWYADIDTVIMKPLSDFSPRNGTLFISSDQRWAKMPKTDSEGNPVIGSKLANGFFGSMVQKYPFLWRSMELFLKTFDNQKWSTGGATPMTQALMEACKLNQPPAVLTGTMPKKIWDNL